MSIQGKRVAVVGGGIAGMGAAHILKDVAEVTLYEKNDYMGGHSRTLVVELDGKPVPVDTGFIVYNERNYPLLSSLFRSLDVPTVKSDMSFGVSIADGWLEYASTSLTGLFGSARNLASPGMWRMVYDIIRFNRNAHKYLDPGNGLSLGEVLDEMDMGSWFRNYYLLPMGGSIWSCPTQQMLEFPAATLLRFFDNHGLLTIRDHPQWYSVKGGAREYVQRLKAAWQDKVHIRTGAQSVQRQPAGGIIVSDAAGEEISYDEVIMACHPDESLKLLENPSPREQRLLSAIRYQPNEVILHTDRSFMPRRRSAWASWGYQSGQKEDRSPAISLSYWMNNLQELQTEVPVIVTLNPVREPDPEHIINRHVFHHPVFDEKAIRAQENMQEIQGQAHVWYCGAWQRYGFHEDGLWSAVRVAQSMGVTQPW